MLIHLPRMDANCINYAETGYFSQAIIQYLDNNPNLAPFYNQRPTLAGFNTLLQQVGNRNINRALLANVLGQQYASITHAGLSVNPAVLNNIQLLAQNNTFTITTGHQLNIFTGPLYFIYKIVTAIKLAQQLKAQYPDKNFVPVYWMATEDHDFAEINHTRLGNKKITWDAEAAGATGRLSTQSIKQALNQYKGVLGVNANAEQLGQLVTLAYTRFNTLANAMRYLVNGLFEQYGLVIIDADHVQLKQQFANVMERDILGRHSFKLISKTNAQLAQLDIHAQVNPREINFFYLLDGLRQRIVFENNQYDVLGTDISFNETELKAEIATHPERFSPNVVMRPLYQETLLPNLAYIGGGAEVVYWLQLKATFDFYDISYPLLILRNSGLLVKQHQVQKFARIGFKPADWFKDVTTLKKEWLNRNSAHELNLKEEWRDLQSTFERLKLRTYKIDPTLAQSSAAVEARLKHALFNLEKKLIKAEKRNYQTQLNQIDVLKAELFAYNSLQERSENFGLFYVRWGQALIDNLIKHFEPLDFKFTVLTETDL